MFTKFVLMMPWGHYKFTFPWRCMITYHTANSCKCMESMGLMPCSCMQFIKTCNFTISHTRIHISSTSLVRICISSLQIITGLDYWSGLLDRPFLHWKSFLWPITTFILPMHALLLKCSHKPGLGDETCGDNSVIAEHCYYNNRASLLQKQSTEHRYHNHAVNCLHMANLRCKNQVLSTKPMHYYKHMTVTATTSIVTTTTVSRVEDCYYNTTTMPIHG